MTYYSGFDPSYTVPPPGTVATQEQLVAYVPQGGSSLPSYGFLAAAGIGWRRGLNNMLNGTRPARILCIGDSTTRGFGDTLDAKGYPGDLATTLFGRGFQSVRGLVTPEFQRGVQAADPRIAYPGGNWTLGSSGSSGLGWGGNDIFWQGAVGVGGMTFTPGSSCDRFDIYWLSFAGGHGSFQASIDGQAATTVNTVTGAATIQKTTVTATNGVQTNHVLTLNNVTTGPVIVIGIEAYNGVTPQVVIGNAGVNGTFSGSWNNTNGVFPNQDVAHTIAAYAPDLSIIMLGVNDADSAVPTATYLANMTALAAACASAGGSVLLVSPIPVNPAQAAGNTVLQAAYTQALIGLAASAGYMMVDLFSRWGGLTGYATLQPKGWFFDNIHPDPVGYWDIATTLATALDNF